MWIGEVEKLRSNKALKILFIFVHWLFIGCSLVVRWLFVGCSLVVRCLLRSYIIYDWWFIYAW